ncbi:acyltransferase [Candidatus Altiarchaeota archaeon]
MAGLKQKCGWSNESEHSLFRQLFNRILHMMAKSLPGAWGFRAFLHKLRGVKIHGDVFISSGVYIDDAHPEYLEIGDNVCLGVESAIITHFRDQKSGIKIEDNVFIGPKSILLPGITIGEGAIIGSNSVVSEDIPPYTFAVGNPAKPIKKVKNPLGVTGSFKDYRAGLSDL